MKIKLIPQQNSCFHFLRPYGTKIVESSYSIDHKKTKTSEIIVKCIKIPNSSVTPSTSIEISPTSPFNCFPHNKGCLPLYMWTINLANKYRLSEWNSVELQLETSSSSQY